MSIQGKLEINGDGFTCSATCVDNDNTWLHPSELGIREALPRMSIEWAVNVDDVRVLKELIERDIFCAVLLCRIESAGVTVSKAMGLEIRCVLLLPSIDS